MEFNLKLQDSVLDILRASATTCRAGEYDNKPCRNPGPPLLVALIFNDVAKDSGMLDSDGQEFCRNEKKQITGDTLSRK